MQERLKLLASCGPMVSRVLRFLSFWKRVDGKPIFRRFLGLFVSVVLPPAGFCLEGRSPGGYIGSEVCMECHPTESEKWQESVHSHAERMLAPELDDPAFLPPKTHENSGSVSRFLKDENGYAIETIGREGKSEQFRPTRVIGVRPLWQYLIPDGDGRYQVTSLAYDPTQQEWFDVFGDENRRPDEWGFWANRGMTWNTMCAGCHNTAFRKNYDVFEDRFSSAMAERGVGCEACHGPGADHVLLRRRKSRWYWWWHEDPIRNPDGTAIVDSCGSCHSRRTALTEDFVPGDRFLDHFIPHLPDFTDTYYPDGQVRDEDYVYSSFLMSRMYHEGVHCMDCHQPHTAKVRVRTNKLCLRCHEGRIDPAVHGHHRLDRRGSLCVGCHMPVTVYMQRQTRHDHSLSIPDPELTVRFGVPNACNRCHTDRSPEWAAEWSEKWYGPPEKRVTARRARVFARAKGPEAADVVPELIRIAKTDPLPVWRAVAARFLGRWVHRPDVQQTLVEMLDASNPLIRTCAAGSLEPLGERTPLLFAPFLSDPVRSVRTRAAWAIRKHLETNDIVKKELEDSLFLNADQVAGTLQLAVYFQDRGETEKAVPLLERAARWDPYSPVVWESLAIALRDSDRLVEAVERLQEGCGFLPENAGLFQSVGLLEAEMGNIDRAVAWLRQACRLDPGLSRAWYNLGLALHRAERSDEAVECLRKAIRLAPSVPDYPFALATLFRDLGRFSESLEFARKTLKIEPRHHGARRLSAWLESRSR